jgi:hypothetical protein
MYAFHNAITYLLAFPSEHPTKGLPKPRTQIAGGGSALVSFLSCLTSFPPLQITSSDFLSY